jgi:hypothetical protein
MQALVIPQARHSKSNNNVERQIDLPESKKLAGNNSNTKGVKTINESLAIVK